MEKQIQAKEISSAKGTAHNLVMEGRKKLSITAVRDITSFEESRVVLETEMGELTVTGQGLHLNNLSVETGEVSLEGMVDGFSYDDHPSMRGQSFWARLFR